MEVTYSYKKERIETSITMDYLELEHIVDLLIRASVTIRNRGDLELSDKLEDLKRQLRDYTVKWED